MPIPPFFLIFSPKVGYNVSPQNLLCNPWNNNENKKKINKQSEDASRCPDVHNVPIKLVCRLSLGPFPKWRLQHASTT